MIRSVLFQEARSAGALMAGRQGQELWQVFGASQRGQCLKSRGTDFFVG